MFETAKPFLLSLALGLMIGIERERSFSGSDRHVSFGARTFTLIALLGSVAGYLGERRPVGRARAFIAAIAVAAYLRPGRGRGHDAGTTTEIAVLLTFALGFLAQSETRLAAMLGVIVSGVLWLKQRIHAFAARGADRSRGQRRPSRFLVIALVVLPLLPNRAIDPWGIANPAKLWLLFVLIAGVGFAGYIAVRALGPERGLAVAGFFAGLVSSTAATLSLSRRAKAEPALAGPLATGIVLANVASAIAQLHHRGRRRSCSLLRDATILIGAPIVVGAVGAVIAAWISGSPASRHDRGDDRRSRQPLGPGSPRS